MLQFHLFRQRLVTSELLQRLSVRFRHEEAKKSTDSHASGKDPEKILHPSVLGADIGEQGEALSCQDRAKFARSGRDSVATNERRSINVQFLLSTITISRKLTKKIEPASGNTRRE